MASLQKLSSQMLRTCQMSTAVGVSHIKPVDPTSTINYQVIAVQTPLVGYYKKPDEMESPLVTQPTVSDIVRSELLSTLPSRRQEPMSPGAAAIMQLQTNIVLQQKQ